MDAVYPRLTTVESFEAMITRAVERAEAALDGEILPEPGARRAPPALTDAEIADASLLTGDEFQSGSRRRRVSNRYDLARRRRRCDDSPHAVHYAETIATFG